MARIEISLRRRRVQGDRLAQRMLLSGARDEAFRDLFELYHDSLVGFFTRRGFDPEAALDLAQETFLHVYQGIDGYSSKTPFENWLFAVAANVRRNELRRRFAVKRSAEEVSIEGSTTADRIDPAEPEWQRNDPLRSILDKERLDELRLVVSSLPPKMKRCFILRVNGGLSHREIADLLRISVPTVRVHLFQARARVRPYLTADAHDQAVVSQGEP